MVLRMRAYQSVHTGVGHTTPTASQHNLFDSEKLNVFLVLLKEIRTLDLLDLQSNALALTTEPTRHPHTAADRCKLHRVGLLHFSFVLGIA